MRTAWNEIACSAAAGQPEGWRRRTPATAQIGTRSVTDEQSGTELSPHLIWRTVPDGTTDYVNQYWNELTGLDREQISAWKSVVAPRDAARIEAQWEAAPE